MCEMPLGMPLEELPDGSVQVGMSCPVYDCKHRFTVRWRPMSEHKTLIAAVKHPIIPPFTVMNSTLFQMMRVHFQRDHS